MLKKGEVIFIDYSRGFGFVKLEESKKVFFHLSALSNVDINSLYVGDIVKVKTEVSKKGLRAISIKKDNINLDNKCDYCYAPIDIIHDEIDRECVPDEALVRTCCWKKICQSRNYNNRIETKKWEELCRRRGYLLARQNSRGF